MYRETQVEHYEPLLVKSRPMIVACCVATAVLVAITWILISESVVRVALTGAILATASGALVTGNCCRLRDLRRRRGRELRERTEVAVELAKLPPLETLLLRLRASCAAAAIGGLGLAGTTAIALLGSYPQRIGLWTALISILAIVVSLLHFVAATYIRPLD
jgi:hypothetical protein